MNGSHKKYNNKISINAILCNYVEYHIKKCGIYNIQNNLNLDKNLLHFIHIFLCGKKGMTKKNKETGGKGDE